MERTIDACSGCCAESGFDSDVLGCNHAVENLGWTQIHTDSEGTKCLIWDRHCSPGGEPKSIVWMVRLSLFPISVPPCLFLV